MTASVKIEVDEPPQCLADTDWLHHRLVVSGLAGTVEAFAEGVRGAGVVPWQLDLDPIEEDLFLRLMGPRPPPQRRSLSLAGARALARQLREAVALRHEVAVAQVGYSRACPLDLHVVVPVPRAILQLGPDHPDALAWLWAHWGTTQALRHVAIEPAPALRSPPPSDSKSVRYSFWSADWTPWRAFALLAERWPGLRFEVRPTYHLRDAVTAVVPDVALTASDDVSWQDPTRRRGRPLNTHVHGWYHHRRYGRGASRTVSFGLIAARARLDVKANADDDDQAATDAGQPRPIQASAVMSRLS